MAGRHGGSKKIVYAALAGNACIAVLKFTVAIVARSSALMAEGFHSMADTGNQALLLYGIKKSAQPPDRKHPFGYGKEQYFWSFVVANMLFMVGAVAAIYEGISKIRNPQPLERPHLVYAILAISFLIEGIVFTVAVRKFLREKGDRGIFQELKGTKDSNLVVVLLEDTAALVGLVIAFIGTFLVQVTGSPLYDGVASILIGVVLALVALFLANEMKKLLIGESASDENLQRIQETITRFPEVDAMGSIDTMHLGPDEILLAVNIDFADQIPAGELEGVIDRIEEGIKACVPEVKQIFIEADTIKGYKPFTGT